ncbi:MAG TPA: sigma-70 family RNA polymerase sigma factor [Gemmatimonadaceae bacterium]|nr:sigma-70 family RNA polymerase sigma factor [Gemmatimonadaceae bacterium]
MLSAVDWPSAEVLSSLVLEARSREPEAIERLLRAIRPGLFAFFERRVGTDAAEDLAQITMMRIAGAITRIDSARADAYLSTVARNVLRTRHRIMTREAGRVGDVDACDLPAATPAPDARVEYAELVRAIHRACLMRLQPGLREIAIGIVRGESEDTIAAELGISPVTVRTRRMRVREVLRRELEAYRETG